MSMIGCYFRISEEDVKKAETGKLDLESLIYDEKNQSNEDITLDIDKAWHAIYFTLTGSSGETDTEHSDWQDLMFGNHSIGDDLGYGPGTLIDASQVKTLSQKLNAVTKEAFREAFSLTDMLANQIYPCMDGEDEEEFFQYVWPNIPAMQAFFEKAAQAGDCIIFFIC